LDELRLFFDGTDVGVGGLDLDAFYVVDVDTILMSFRTSAPIGSLGTVADSDIVRFDASSLGATTAGSFSMYFDGLDVGLDTSGEDIDAIELLSDGWLVISTRGSFSVSGVKGADEDLRDLWVPLYNLLLIQESESKQDQPKLTE